MSEELRIEVDVKANDDSAKKTLDGLIKEYTNKYTNYSKDYSFTVNIHGYFFVIKS